MNKQGILLAFLSGAVGIFALMTMLYVWLTADRRRAMHEIRQQVEMRGWRFRTRHWMGNPTAFRIEGRSAAGWAWVAKTESAGESQQGWTEKLTINVPELAGAFDFVLIPRGPRDPDLAGIVQGVSPAVKDRIAGWSGLTADAMRWAEECADAPTGWPDFDAAYKVMIKPGHGSPLNGAMAQRMQQWPPSAVRAKQVLAWRGPYGLHFEARLPSPANWGTVEHATALADELAGRLPPAEIAVAPKAAQIA